MDQTNYLIEVVLSAQSDEEALRIAKAISNALKKAGVNTAEEYLVTNRRENTIVNKCFTQKT